MSDAPIPLGDIRFYDSYLSLLDAADYTISVHQHVESTDAQHPLSQGKDVVQPFSVIAPRFALDPSEVQSVFPPANAVGPFVQNLPHIVLMQRALPWERELGDALPKPANPNVEAYPWVALLLFTEDEILSPPGALPGSALANPTKVGTYPVDQARIPADATILGSNVPTEREDDPTCRAIDISTDVFTQVTPRLAELPFLAHARQVNVDSKTTSLALTNGWFSVVTGNRFPVAKSTAGTRNIAHLVSLEGFAPYLVDAPAWPAGKTTVRLPSLVSWAFTAHPEGADFAGLMAHLVDGQAKGGDGLRLRLPVPVAPSPTPNSPADQAQQALSQGYAPLQYETRFGDQTFAWYHGPLVPHPLPPVAGATAFASSAAATVYDPDSGTFDLSYAASWELGRLLALADRAYSTNQQRGRKALRKVMNLVRERTRWSDGQRLLAAAQTGALAELMHPRQVSRSVASWLGAEAAAHLPRQDRAAAAPPAAQGRRPPRAGAVEGLRALHAQAGVQALVRSHVQQAMTDGPLDDVVGWLGRLRLLEGVPFVHLIPDARMLPTESIRFFYVDRNVLDALCDGAQSVGVQTSRDALQQGLVRDTVRAAAIARAHAHRATLLGRVQPLDVTPSDPVAGFLMRSAVVSGWPGLEVQAFGNTAGTDPIKPLRLDHVASDVLLALYPRLPARIDVEEPKEGLAFGIEDVGEVTTRLATDPDIGKVAVRSIVGSNIGTVLSEVMLKGSHLRQNGVLRVDAWQDFLSGQLPVGSAATWGPAAFALQMVRLPERMTFDNGGNA
jgi:hypothetical protein